MTPLVRQAIHCGDERLFAKCFERSSDVCYHRTFLSVVSNQLYHAIFHISLSLLYPGTATVRMTKAIETLQSDLITVNGSSKNGTICTPHQN